MEPDMKALFVAVKASPDLIYPTNKVVATHQRSLFLTRGILAFIICSFSWYMMSGVITSLEGLFSWVFPCPTTAFFTVGVSLAVQSKFSVSWSFQTLIGADREE